jgi:hypothetical protein
VRWRLVIFAVLLTASFGLSAAEGTGPSIYEFISAHRDPATGLLTADGLMLPDEPTARRYSRLRWVPGALEGLGTRHMHWDGSEKAYGAARLLEAIAAGKGLVGGNGIATGSASAEAALYELLRADDVVTFYSDALDSASARTRNVEPTLHELARRLAITSRDRGPVKFGIAMLGSMGDPRDLDILQTLALHDEFGLYAAEAIGEIAPDRQTALYDMARKVSGWGRIEAVSRLVATSDPGLRHWLLTEGFRNSINPQYLAHQCVSIADLAGALAEGTERRGDEVKTAGARHPGAATSTPDAALLLGASDLLQALIKSGPAPGLDNYSDAPQAVDAFLRLIQKRRDSVSFFLAAQAVHDYTGSHAAKPDARAQWTASQLSDAARLADNVIADSSWHRRVMAALADDRAELGQAAAAADKLKIDTFDLHLRALGRNPANPQRWALAFAAADPARAPRLIALAERDFGGARDGARTRPAATLEAVLQGIAGYPGAGLPLVESSLTDHDNAVRRAAVETLVRWGSAYLRGASVRTALNDAARTEADEALKARMVALLNLGTLP